MDLHTLTYFTTVVQEKSFTKAAAKLYVAQPSLSASISRLEKSLGIKLLIRNNGDVTPTAYGKVYFDACLKILDIQANMLDKINDIRKTEGEVIVVGSTGERTIRFISTVLPAFYAKFPNTHIEICENTTKNLTNLLLNGEIDFSINPIINETPGLVSETIKIEEVVYAIPKSHILAKYGKDLIDDLEMLSLSEFKNSTFVLLKKNTILRKVIDNFFLENDFEPEDTMEVENNHSNMLILNSGISSVGFCPRDCNYHLKNVVYAKPSNPIYYKMALNYRKGIDLSASKKYFSSLIFENGSLF